MRRLLSVICLGLMSGLGFADPIFHDIPGSYAIYQDTRFDDEVYLGLAFAGEDTLVARSYEVKTGNELVLMVAFVRDQHGGFDMAGDFRVLKGNLGSSPAAGRLLPMLLNWGNAWIKERETIEANLTLQVSADDDYFYQYWVPVFQLERIGDPQNRFSLVTVGILKGPQDPQFFGFQGFPAFSDVETYSITPTEAQTPVIDGLKVPLDSNWKSTDGRVFRLQHKTPQDAAFFVETIRLKEKNIASAQVLAKLLLIANQESPLVAQGSRIFRTNGVYNCFLRSFDPKTGRVSIQESQIVDRGDGVVSIVSLASFEALYLANQSYFDRILY